MIFTIEIKDDGFMGISKYQKAISIIEEFERVNEINILKSSDCETSDDIYYPSYSHCIKILFYEFNEKIICLINELQASLEQN